MSIQWIHHVFADSEYAGTRLLIHLALADNASDEGVCWPSRASIARKARCSTRYVTQVINEMVADGLLEVEDSGMGRGNTPVYRLLKGELCDIKGELHDTKRGTVRHEKGNFDAPYIREPSRTVIEPNAREAQFDEFYAAYPKKVGKGAARRAYFSAIKKVCPEELLRALKGYRFKDDPEFIPHAATWLNGERWADEQQGVGSVLPEE